jgi:cellobiose-specific phosphotransferase system component IIC
MRSSIWLIIFTLPLTGGYIWYARENQLKTDFQSVSQFAFSALSIMAVSVLLYTLQRHESANDETFGKAVRSKIDVVLTSTLLMLLYSAYDLVDRLGLVNTR